MVESCSDRSMPCYSEEQLDEIIAWRAVIEQAKGMLMYINGIDANEAFEAIRSRARHGRLTVRDLAERIVADSTTANDFCG